MLAGNEAPRMTEVPADTVWSRNDRPEAWDSDFRRRRENNSATCWTWRIRPGAGRSRRLGGIGAGAVSAPGDRRRLRPRRRIVAALAAFDPFRRLPRNISIGQVRVDGTRITVESPKISGIQKDGHPYEVMAQAGIQDTTTPNIVELLGIDAKIGLNDASTLKVTAEHGTYDSLNDHLVLDGSAQIKNDSGYAIFMKTAHMDFKTGALSPAILSTSSCKAARSPPTTSTSKTTARSRSKARSNRSSSLARAKTRRRPPRRSRSNICVVAACLTP